MGVAQVGGVQWAGEIHEVLLQVVDACLTFEQLVDILFVTLQNLIEFVHTAILDGLVYDACVFKP